MAIDGINGYRAMNGTSAAKFPGSGAATGTAGLSGPGGGPGADPYRQLEDYVKLTPAQRIRVDLLEKLGLTEEELASMTPEQRKAVEEKLRDLVQQQMQEAQARQAAPDKVGQWIDTLA